jgi:hypothetical protein
MRVRCAKLVFQQAFPPSPRLRFANVQRERAHYFTLSFPVSAARRFFPAAGYPETGVCYTLSPPSAKKEGGFREILKLFPQYCAIYAFHFHTSIEKYDIIRIRTVRAVTYLSSKGVLFMANCKYYQQQFP